MGKKEEIIRLFEGIERQLDQDWAKFRDQHHNPSNKGASYEETLKDFLDKYFADVYDIRTQTTVIDNDLDVFDLFDTNRGEHEVDVVALFQSARPRIVFEVESMTYVPLAGAAFIAEVKSEVDSGRLESDLQKLDKITSLFDEDGDRFPIAQTGEYTSSRQIRCLVYDENSISEDTLAELLLAYEDCWDMILFVQENRLFINSSLPIFEDIKHPLAEVYPIGEDNIEFDSADQDNEDREKIIDDANDNLKFMNNVATSDHGLILFLMFLSGSIPRPLGVETTETLNNLYKSYLNIQVQNQS